MPFRQTSEILGGRRRTFRVPVARAIGLWTGAGFGSVGCAAIAATALARPELLNGGQALTAGLAWLTTTALVSAAVAWRVSKVLARPADTLLALKRIEGDTAAVDRNELAKAFSELDELLLRTAHEKNGRIGELIRARDSARIEGESQANFFASMSHELRTPLNAIIGYAMLLAEDAASAGQTRQAGDLDRILESSRRLLRLINDILDLSRLDAGDVSIDRSVIDVSVLVKGVTASLADSAARAVATVEANVAPNARVMLGDAVRLRQCLCGLVENLLETHPGGSVRLDVILSDADGAHIEFRLSDRTGSLTAAVTKALEIEIAQAQGEDAHALASDVLAMTVARRLAALMGGALLTEPAAEHDVVVLSVPLNAAAERAVSPPIPTPEPPRQPRPLTSTQTSDRRTVLVIDDDASTADLMSRWLTSQGYRVISANNGGDGLALLRSEWPDFVILDVFMPGQSGYEVLAEIKADPRTRAIPVVIVSSDDNRQLGIESGAAEVLVKPLSRKRLSHVLDVLSAQVAGDILVVDDDDDVREIVQRFASQAGLTVRLAADGAEGLALARASTPGAIILDLCMPGTDGFAMIDALANDPGLSHVPVMVLSQLNISVQEHARIRQAGHVFHPKWKSSPTQIVENIKIMVAR